MKVFIIGNIGSGKTYLSKKIGKRFCLSRYSIDEIRRKINMGADIYGEEAAWMTLKKVVQTTDNIIVESSGAGKHFESLITMAGRSSVLIIKIDTLPAQCIKNIRKRELSKRQNVPFPYKFDVKSSLERNKIILDQVPADIVYTIDRDEELWKVLDVVLKR